MMKKIIPGILLILLIGQAAAVLPPEERKKRCEKTGGEWINKNCKCPAEATSLWSICWETTPKETCEAMGGKKEKNEEIVGPEGSSFVCMKNGQDVTEQALNNAILYNESPETTSTTAEKPENDSTEIYIGAIIILIIAGSIYYFTRNSK